jgi:hypothetical protein
MYRANRRHEVEQRHLWSDQSIHPWIVAVPECLVEPRKSLSGALHFVLDTSYVGRGHFALLMLLLCRGLVSIEVSRQSRRCQLQGFFSPPEFPRFLRKPVLPVTTEKTNTERNFSVFK